MTYNLPVTSTYYPVCATPANELTQGPTGNNLVYLGGTAANVQPFDLATYNSYDCCALCFQTPGCLGSNYAAAYGDTSCELEITTDATCPANQGGNAGLYTEDSTAAFGTTFSNGPCGTFLYQ